MTGGSASGAGADIVGATLLVGSPWMLVVYAIVEAANDGWGLGTHLGFGGAGVAMLAGFLIRQATASNPLMPLRVFRARDVTAANLIQMSLVAGLFGVFFLGALYMEHVLGYDPIQIGLAFLPLALGIAVMSLGVSARLIARADRCSPHAGAEHGAGRHRDRPLPGPRHSRAVSVPVAAGSSRRAIGIGGGLAFPSLMTLGYVHRNPRGFRTGLRASSTPASRWAERWVCRCWRRLCKQSCGSRCAPLA